MLGARCLKQRLVCTATTGDDTDHTTDAGLDDLLGTRGELDASLALIGVVANNGNVVARGSAESTTVADLLLDVGDNGTFRAGSEGEDVADGQRGVLSGVDELASVHALVGDEGLGVELEAVGVTEDDLGEGSTTSGVVDDLLHDTTGVSMSLGKVESTELSGGLVESFEKRNLVSESVRELENRRGEGDAYWCWPVKRLLSAGFFPFNTMCDRDGRTVKIEPRPFL